MTGATGTGPLVTLTTDFGTRDGYVGSMKGVLLTISPSIRIVDITHALPPHKLVPAALALREACPRFPPGTIHVAVVDPGVGGQRRPILLRVDGRFYVGPDNGIFGMLVEGGTLQGAWRLRNPAYFLSPVSDTFHGRDIFAPVAAHLAAGVPAEAFGETLADPTPLTLPAPRVQPDHMEGRVIHVDRFGNCITNLDATRVRRWSAGSPLVIRAASASLREISRSYDAVPERQALAIIGSMGTLEIACNRGRGNELLGLGTGDRVLIEKRPHERP